MNSITKTLTTTFLTTLLSLSSLPASPFSPDSPSLSPDSPPSESLTPHRSQPSSKLLAITILPSCPTPDLLTQITQTGEEMGADFTLFPEVQGASLCPSTIYGPMWGTSTWGTGSVKYDWRGNVEGTIRLRGGVTVGLHYLNTR